MGSGEYLGLECCVSCERSVGFFELGHVVFVVACGFSIGRDERRRSAVTLKSREPSGPGGLVVFGPAHECALKKIVLSWCHR